MLRIKHLRGLKREYIIMKKINTQEKIFEIMSHTKVQYPIDTVVELATRYVSSGNLRKSARESGVSEETASDWSRTQWFADVLGCVRFEHQKKLDSKITSLLDRAVSELEDRLTNGDINEKTGERVPVRAAQVASILGTLYDKRALIRGEPTSRVERTSVDQRLNKLHKRFEEIGKSTAPAVIAEGHREDDVKH